MQFGNIYALWLFEHLGFFYHSKIRILAIPKPNVAAANQAFKDMELLIDAN